MDHLPSLNAVRYFEASARHQSFTAAAHELNVTPGAVSRMVQALEEELGAPLFTRSGRFIALTLAGVAYQKEVSAALGRIATASQRVRDSASNEALSLIVNAGFATRWLVQRLADFQRLHPQIRVDILGGEADEKAYGDQAQMAVRYGVPPWPGSVATRLPIGGVLGVVCAPTLSAASGPLKEAKDLLGKPLLAYASGKRDPWQDFFTHFELPQPNLGNARRFAQLLMVVEAATSGLGFALVPLFLVEADLASGRLVQAIPQTLQSERGYYITHAKRADSDSKVLLFKKWLTATARKSALQAAPRSR
jgi:LysR family glycine cleavage system transcriptional activator